MLAKCVNPACSTPLRYLRGGKVIRVSLTMKVKSGHHPIEHFWFCGPCSEDYELVARPEGGISVIRRNAIRLGKSTILSTNSLAQA
jgi:LSD1 subclass zinc finger protein